MRKSAFLRTVAWLALVLVVAGCADLVEDLVFELEEATAAEGDAQAEAADEDIVPSPSLNSSTPLNHFVLLTPAVGTGGVMWLTQAAPSEGRVLIHGPPSSGSLQPFMSILPLRI